MAGIDKDALLSQSLDDLKQAKPKKTGDEKTAPVEKPTGKAALDMSLDVWPIYEYFFL